MDVRLHTLDPGRTDDTDAGTDSGAGPGTGPGTGPGGGPGLPISETFLSLQGEGSLAGVPSWFCRLSGCNLRCRWCDTPYASWDPVGPRRDIDGLLREALASGARHAVLTGGEPMIFPRLVELADGLRQAGLHVTIETAGTVDLDAPFDLLSLSPKLANSTPIDDPRDPTGAWARRHEARRINPQALHALLGRAFAPGRAAQLKFVVTTTHDLAEIDALVASLPPVPPDRVFLMPEGTSLPDPAAVAWVVRACLHRGWRYGHRLHIEIFGHTRGT